MTDNDARIVLEGFEDVEDCRNIIDILTEHGIKREVIEVA
jgi:hypothetical protein